MEVPADWMKTAVIGEGSDGGIVYNRVSSTQFATRDPSRRAHRAKTKGKVERLFRYIREDFPLLVRSATSTIRTPRPAPFDTVTIRKSAPRRPGVSSTNSSRAVVSAAVLPLAPFKSVLKLERRYRGRHGQRRRQQRQLLQMPHEVALRSTLLPTKSASSRTGTLIAAHLVLLEGRKQRRVHPDHRRSTMSQHRQRTRDESLCVKPAGDTAAAAVARSL